MHASDVYYPDIDDDCRKFRLNGRRRLEAIPYYREKVRTLSYLADKAEQLATTIEEELSTGLV